MSSEQQAAVSAFLASMKKARRAIELYDSDEAEASRANARATRDGIIEIPSEGWDEYAKRLLANSDAAADAGVECSKLAAPVIAALSASHFDLAVEIQRLAESVGGSWRSVTYFKTHFLDMMAKLKVFGASQQDEVDAPATVGPPRVEIGPMNAMAFGIIFDGGEQSERTYRTYLNEWKKNRNARSPKNGEWYILQIALSAGQLRRAESNGH